MSERRALIVPIQFGAFGLQRTEISLASELLASGWSVDVAVREPLDFTAAEERFGLKTTGVRTVTFSSPSKYRLVRKFMSGARERAFRKLTAKYDLAWVQSTWIPMRSAARFSVLFTEFPFETPPQSVRWRRRLASYNEIVGNSDFTRAWIERAWEHRAGVFFPSIAECPPLTKKRTILSVGRFTGAKRSKGQLEMVKTFRRMVENGLEPGWQLVLVGLREDPSYCDAVEEAADGLPCRLRFDCPFPELQRHYGEASLYWHASGLGVDQEQEPSLLEHFGISVAEAMSAGAVPVVFDGGGPKEIVGETGVVWSSLGELAERTVELVADQPKMERLSAAARARVEECFGQRAFEDQVRALVRRSEALGHEGSNQG